MATLTLFLGFAVIIAASMYQPLRFNRVVIESARLKRPRVDTSWNLRNGKLQFRRTAFVPRSRPYAPVTAGWGPVRIPGVGKCSLWEDAARSGYRSWFVDADLFWPMVVFGSVAVCAWWHGRRGSPAKCVACSYDLRGLPDAAACPECGAKDHVVFVRDEHSTTGSMARAA